MNILFVNSERIGSKIIQYGTDENISHVAVGFEDHGFIYHAYGTGIQKTPVQEFFEHYNLIDHVAIRLEPRQEKKVLDRFVRSIWYQGYDYGSLFYFAWDRLKVKFFGAKESKVNAMNSDDDVLCTEVVMILEEAYQTVTGKILLPDDLDLSITKPGVLRTILKSRF